MKYANNPQAFMNGFLSGSRNIFLTSSIAIAMYGFSNTFKMDFSVNMIKILSIMVFLFSIMLGINTLFGYYDYLKKLQKDKANLPEYINLNVWWSFLYITMVYIIILIAIVLLALIRFRNRIINV